MSDYKKRCDEVLLSRARSSHDGMKVDRKMTDLQLLEMLNSARDSQRHGEEMLIAIGRELL